MVIAAFAISGAMLYVTYLNGNIKDNTISSGFGAVYGIHDITNSPDQGLEGLPSNTVSFKVADNDPISALQYTSTFMESETEGGEGNELLNFKISSDDDSATGFSLDFYANSPADYLDGTFDESITSLKTLISEGDFSNVAVVSKPTQAGTRTLSVTASLNSGSSNKSALAAGWNSLVGAVQSFPINGSRYNLSMATEGDIVTGVSGFYYDEASYELLKQIDPRVWSTLEAYTGKDVFKVLGITQAKYVIAQGAGTNDSAFRVVLAGDQPDAETVNSIIGNFKSSAYSNPDVMLPWMNITTLKFANATEPFYIDYPTNMLW